MTSPDDGGISENLETLRGDKAEKLERECSDGGLLILFSGKVWGSPSSERVVCDMVAFLLEVLL